MSDSTFRILVLCTGNSCRSQMAEVYLRKFLGDAAQVVSAGIEAHGLNPRAMQVLQDDGMETAGLRSKTVDEFQHSRFDLLLTVCDHARETCPLMPGIAKQLHQSFPDPAKAQGTEEEILRQFRSVRDQIREFCREFSKKQPLA